MSMIKTPRIGALRHLASRRATDKRRPRASLRKPVIHTNVIEVPPTTESEYAALLDRLVNGESQHG
jgi:hypothetical protein